MFLLGHGVVQSVEEHQHYIHHKETNMHTVKIYKRPFYRPFYRILSNFTVNRNALRSRFAAKSQMKS